MDGYYQALCDAMTLVAEQPGSVFIGQAVAADGCGMSKTFRHLPPEKLIEFPVAENMQISLCTGIAIAGGVPLCAFPRINFMLECVSGLVQHLDRIPIFSNGGYRPRVLIRTAIATPHPLDPGEQHLGDYSEAFRMMFKTIKVRRLHTADSVVPAYKEALEYEGSTLLVEFTENYT
jgi:pyruvate/2-oxoglutarate/acetoin dehydrogenase E1 component